MLCQRSALKLEKTECKTLRSNNEEICVFDIVKMVLAFFVVCIHTGVHTGNSAVDFYMVQGLFRIAVPFFFFMAGYFLFTKIPDEKRMNTDSCNVVKKYILRMFFLYAVWSALYLFYQMKDWIADGADIRRALIYIEYATVRGDSYLHLWYLSSLFTGVALIYLFRKVLSLKGVLVVSALFFIIGLFLLPYYFLIKPIVEGSGVLSFLYEMFSRFIGGPRCGLFFGFFFISLGAYFAYKDLKLKPWVSISGLLLSFVLSFAEITVIDNNWAWGSGSYGGLQFSHIPLVIFFFCFLRMFKNIHISNAKTIRKISTIVYLIHPAIMLLLNLVPKIEYLFAYPFLKGLLVYVLSIAFSALLINLEKVSAFSFLKKLH